LVKIAPDLSEAEIEEIVGICTRHDVDGIIATNTTVSRDGLTTPDIERFGAGGLSGRPVACRANDVIRAIYKYSNGKMPVVGVNPGRVVMRSGYGGRTDGAQLALVPTRRPRGLSVLRFVISGEDVSAQELLAGCTLGHDGRGNGCVRILKDLHPFGLLALALQGAVPDRVVVDFNTFCILTGSFQCKVPVGSVGHGLDLLFSRSCADWFVAMVSPSWIPRAPPLYAGDSIPITDVDVVRIEDQF
jgi:hypothetical protein